MLSGNKIDKILKKYVKEHLSKGYSRHAVKHVLVNHGYDENYVNKILREHAELEFVKKYAILASLLFVISFSSFNLIFKISHQQQMTGYAAASGSGEGCCTPICQQTPKNECYGKFTESKKCNELDECNVGCCIDKEGYCLTNYLEGNCLRGYGTRINRDCKDVVFCRNITDKSYESRLYNINGKKGAGIPILKTIADYYKSSFNIQYYLYDNKHVIGVAANIMDGQELADSIALYDDGSHNDGAKNDNLYGNNWLSSKIRDFDGFKKLDIDIIVKYEDGTQQQINKTQTIVVLNKNKCLPVFNEWGNPEGKISIIFAADNYDSSNYGYPKFEADTANFLNVLFSIDKFRSERGNFNIYRFEQSLSYFNIPTLTRLISSSCPSYSSKKDMVIVLDNNEQYCAMEGKNVARINPQVLFYKNITNSEINNTFDGFCSYALTPRKLADQITAFATPPKITVNTLENITYNESDINFSFTVSAVNYPVNNSVFLDNVQVFNKITEQESEENVLLNLANGTNYIYIKSIDRNKNKAFAQLLLNATTR